MEEYVEFECWVCGEELSVHECYGSEGQTVYKVETCKNCEKCIAKETLESIGQE